MRHLLLAVVFVCISGSTAWGQASRHVAERLVDRSAATCMAAAGGRTWIGGPIGLVGFSDARAAPIIVDVDPAGVTALAADAAGALYVGTAQGLFTLTSDRALRKLSNASVTGLAVAGDEVWIGCADGLRVRHANEETRVGNEAVVKVIGHDNQVWVLTDQKLSRVYPEPASVLATSPQKGHFINAWVDGGAVVVQVADPILSGTPNRVDNPCMAVRGGRLVPLLPPRPDDGPASHWEIPLDVDAHGRMWCRHYDLQMNDMAPPAGLTVFDGWNELKVPEDAQPSEVVNAVVHAADGTVWVLGNRGAAWYRGSEHGVLRVPSVLPDPSEVERMVLRGPVRWFLVSDAATAVDANGTVMRHDELQSLDGHTTAAAANGRGVLYAGGWYKDTGSTMEQPTIGEGVRVVAPSGTPQPIAGVQGHDYKADTFKAEDVVADRKGGMLILGTLVYSEREGDLLIHDVGDGHPTCQPVPLLATALAAGRDNSVYAVGENRVAWLHQGRWSTFAMPAPRRRDEYDREAAFAACVDANETLWVARHHELMSQDRAARWVRRSAGSASLVSMDVAADGTPWVVDEHGHLFVPVGGTLHEVPVDFGRLKVTAVSCLRFDSAGRLWIATDAGVLRLDP